jgi:hypothetical protein
LYSCHTKRKVHTIKKILLTKMILDTAVTSEDLSHTTMKKKIYVRKKLQTNNYMYYCTLSTLKNNKKACYYKLHKTM